MSQDRRWLLKAAGIAIGGAALGAGQTGTAASAAGPAETAGGSHGRPRRLYIGTYGGGIKIANADPATGLPTITATVDSADPSYLALSPDGRTLYASSEVAPGTVSAFALRRHADPTPLGPVRGSGGLHPAYVHAHPSGRYVLTANYSSGTVGVLPVRPDGSLGELSDVFTHTRPDPDPTRPARAHKVLTDPAGRYVHSVDLGLDLIFGFRLSGGKLSLTGVVRSRPGAGPRHLAFHPTGRTAYVANELDSTLTVFGYDARTGRLTPGQTIDTAPPTPVRNYPSEVIVSPDGRFVYLANRGHNSVAVFAVDKDTVVPRGTVPTGGNWPRHIALTADGRYLYVANQNSGTINTFHVNRRDGSLSSAGAGVAAGTPALVLPV